MSHVYPVGLTDVSTAYKIFIVLAFAVAILLSYACVIVGFLVAGLPSKVRMILIFRS